MKLIPDNVLYNYSTNGAIFGGHPDSTKLKSIIGWNCIGFKKF